jgi:hypothetical protein
VGGTVSCAASAALASPPPLYDFMLLLSDMEAGALLLAAASMPEVEVAVDGSSCCDGPLTPPATCRCCFAFQMAYESVGDQPVPDDLGMLVLAALREWLPVTAPSLRVTSALLAAAPAAASSRCDSDLATRAAAAAPITRAPCVFIGAGDSDAPLPAKSAPFLLGYTSRSVRHAALSSMPSPIARVASGEGLARAAATITGLREPPSTCATGRTPGLRPPGGGSSAAILDSHSIIALSLQGYWRGPASPEHL